MAMFIRDFISEAQAETFARARGGKVIVRYDYDISKGCIVKYFRVKY